MAGEQGPFDWGGLTQALIGGLGAYGASRQQGKATNQAVSQAAFNPFNVNFGGIGGANFGGQGISGGVSDQYSALRSQLMGLAGQGATGLGGASFGGYMPGLNSAFQGANSAYPGTPNLGQLGQQGNTLAQGSNFLGQVGGQLPQVNPQMISGLPQVGGGDIYGTFQNRLGMLRNMAQPQEQRYLQNNFDNQFGKGILASSAGSYQTEGALNSINQADLQRQQSAYGMAGDDWTRQMQASQANQQAALVAGQANQQAGLQGGIANQNAAISQQGLFGQLGQGLSGMGIQEALNRFAQNNQASMAQYGAGAQSAQDRFQRALQLFGAGTGVEGENAQLNQQRLAGGMGGVGNIDNIPLQLAQLGMNAGAMGANAGANQAGLTYSNGVNNANLLASFANGLSTSGVGNWVQGLFGDKNPGRGGGLAAIPSGLQAGTPGWMGINDPNWGFKGAGGQATAPSINDLQPFTPTVSKLPVPGGTGINVGAIASRGGVTNGLDVLGGLAQGGAQGYGKAVTGGANLASMMGAGGLTTDSLGLLGNAASGNYLGAAKSGLGMLSGVPTAAGSLFGTGAGVSSGIASGAAANAAVAQQLGGKAATSAVGGAAGASSVLGSALAGAGYAGLVIGAGKLLSHAFGGGGSTDRNLAAFDQTFPDLPTYGFTFGRNARGNYTTLPNGAIINASDKMDLAGAMYGAMVAPDGDQAGWQKKLDGMLAKFTPDYKSTLPKGYVWKDGKIIRG